MAIKKQEFYEGAALHQIARSGAITSIRYDSPFFLLNDRLLVLLKYSTKGRSPWGFTLTGNEQSVLLARSAEHDLVIGFVCGADGVAAVEYDALISVASLGGSPIHIACYRKYDKHYEISGPEGTLDKKIAPSMWNRILLK